MSSPKGKRDIVRLHTFADDFKRAQKNKWVAGPEKIPENNDFKSEDNASAYVPEKEVAGEVMEAEGIVFESTASKNVTDQAYEENMAVTKETEERKNEVLQVPGVEEIAATIVKQKESLLSDNDDSFKTHDSQNLGGGTIIRDTKRKRFQLIPAIGESIKNWFGEKKENIEESRREKFTVTKAEARVETIKAAAQKQTQAPDEDYKQVAERLKRVERKAIDASVEFKPKEVVTPSWSQVEEKNEVETPTTSAETTESINTPSSEKILIAKEEASVPLGKPATAADFLANRGELVKPVRPTDATQTVQITSKKVITEAPRTEETVVSKISEDIASILPETGALGEVPNENVPTGIETVMKSVPREDLSVQKTAPAEVSPAPPKEESEVMSVSQPVSKPKQKKALRVPRFTTPKLPEFTVPRVSPIAGGIAVLLLSSVLGVGASFYFFGKEAPTQQVAVQHISSLVRAEQQNQIQFSSDYKTFFETILSSIRNNTKVVQVYPTTETAEGDVPTDIATVALLLTQNAPASFTRSITDITLGGVSGEPFIVMKVTNFDTGFAGMLGWEQTMSGDLSPLFGPVVTESYDSHARTDTQVRNAFFADVVTSNKSARLLVDETDRERIIYSFVDKTTIVITTTKTALGAIIPFIR